MIEWAKLLERAVELIVLGVLGAFGGIANYVYTSVKKDRKFQAGLFVANMVMAAFVGVFVGQFIGIDNPYRDGYIMAFGFSAYPVLQVLEDRLKMYLNRWLPGE